jgi:threonine aldolase
VFPILPDALLEALAKEFSFTEMGRVDETHRAVRFYTSWATRPDQMEALCKKLRDLT